MVILLIEVGTSVVLTWTALIVGLDNLVVAEINISGDAVTVEETSGASAEPK